MYNRNGIILALVATFALMSACTRDSGNSNDPKRRLTDYISKSFAVNGIQDRDELMRYMTGEAKTRLAAWSDEQFKEAFIDSKRKFLKLVFTETKQPSPGEFHITYELTYLDQGKGHDAKVSNKKLCQMVLDKGSWVIKDVRSIKELVEYQNEMSLP
ncbi:MAG TPA: hypothetical protein VJB59_03120 [Bdellovibrionota bacterium]|nr:hypothetical protein [Bdellovibrionota bacterium]